MMVDNNCLFIKKITFENWAQFENLTIDFPLPNDENAEIPVVFFLGRNAAGKTKIFQGIRVALFGKGIIEPLNMFDLFPNAKKKVISEEISAGNNYPNQTTSLTIELLEKGNGIKKEHKIIRSFIFSDFEISSSEPLLISKQCEGKLDYKYRDLILDSDWKDGDLDKLEEMIEDWFPPEVRDFYFFDGEKSYELMIKNDVNKNDLINNIISRKAKQRLGDGDIKEEFKSEIIQHLKDQTNKTFLDLVEPESNYDSVYISENWDLGFYLKENPNEPIVGENGPTRGQHHILGLSFLNAILETTNFNIPTLFDTPLGRIDEHHTENIGKKFISLFKGAQTILFLTGSEAKDMITHVSGKQGWIIKRDDTFAYIEEINEKQLNDYLAGN